MSPRKKLSARIIALVSVYSVVALAALYWMLRTESAQSDVAALSVFIVAAWIAEALFIRISGSLVISASFPISFAALIAMGPLAGALTAAVTSLDVHSMRTWRERSEKIIFNAAQLLIGFGAAGYVYAYLGGSSQLIRSADLPDVLLPIVVATFIVYAFNMLSVAIAIAVSENIKLKRVISMMFGASGIFQHLTLTILGILLAQIFGMLHVVGLLLLAIPLLVSRQIHAVYITHKAAYLDALGALVGALEAKDKYTRGHSERVASFSYKTGLEMGLSEKDLDDLRMAGLLHDIGKIAVKGSILRKPGGLTSDEFSNVKRHAETGASIVDHIKLLSRAIPGIKYHHEKVDGTGYGRLRDDEIPLIAKILCVADAYDSMTSSRSYREPVSKEKALTELQSCAGSQFDPKVVDSFAAALASTK